MSSGSGSGSKEARSSGRKLTSCSVSSSEFVNLNAVEEEVKQVKSEEVAGGNEIIDSSRRAVPVV